MRRGPLPFYVGVLVGAGCWWALGTLQPTQPAPPSPCTETSGGDRREASPALLTRGEL